MIYRAQRANGDAACVGAYCGNSTVLEEAFAEWAESYAGKTDRDHAMLLAAINCGEIKAQVEPDDGT